MGNKSVCRGVVGVVAALSIAGFIVPSSFAQDISSYANREWKTFGGDYANTRFSQLAQIDADNVHRLQLLWEFHTGLSPNDPWYNFSTVPLIVNQVMYLSDPGNYFTPFQSVFAVDAKTGKEIWHRALPLGAIPEARGQGNVRSTRGVAYGQGRIYMGTQDATIWALDAQSGKSIDSFGDLGKVVIADVAAGFYLSSPPIYVPKQHIRPGGRASGHNVLLLGIAGGENETRGFMSAYDADNGELLWRFFTVPAPSEYGGDSWPTGTGTAFADPYTRGGAVPWMPPAFDPQMGLVVFSTGNAGPDFDGTHRAGDNLFASSIVAVDVRDGRRVWHFQEVHHDVWDYDQASPPVLFEVKHHGKSVKAVGAAGKTGWFYILDRTTGSPIYPCPERSVVTATTVIGSDGAPEKLSPTQPFCESDAFVPQGGRINSTGQHISPIFTPPGLPTPGATGPFLFPILPSIEVHDELVEPGVIGGSDWGPTSFNPQLGLAFIGGNVLPMRYTAKPEAAPTPGPASEGGWWSYTADEQGHSKGTLTAMDVATGKIRWQVQTEQIVYNGSCATAGNLVFIGETDANPTAPLLPLSYFSAYDARTGERLFRYRVPNDVPVDAPCVSYAIEDRQYIAIAVGGGIGMLSKGDAIYVFGLPKNEAK